MSRQINIESLDKKIEAAEKAVAKARAQYDQATGELKTLLDKRDALRRNEIVKAIAKSSKSYEEILAYITAGSVDE